MVIAPPDAQFWRERIDDREATPNKEPRHDPYGYDRRWSPYRPTVAYVESVAFGLAVIEMTESVEMRYVNGKYIRESEYVLPKNRRYVDHTWTRTRDLPSGRLRLVVYSAYRGVSWLSQYQETKARTLTLDIPKIVKSIERELAPMIEKMQEAERQAEIWRLDRLAEEEKRRQKEDQRLIALSMKESRDQLEQVIQTWSKVITLEQFFQGIEDLAQHLSEPERRDVLERLQLARGFIGTQNPLDFFRAWKTPVERYVPLYQRSPGTQPSDGDDDGC